MDWNTTTYVAYLLVAVPLTVWVARVLSRNGRVFLADLFDDHHGLADAVNALLVAGFYLVNVGFVLLFLRTGEQADDLGSLLEVLSRKIGIVMLVLGVLHFGNVFALTRMRRRHPGNRPVPAPPGAPAPGTWR